MQPEALAVVAGAGSALAYGVGDFSGGFASRTDPVVRVVLLSCIIGVIAFAAMGFVTAEPWPDGDTVWRALVGGAAVTLGVLAFYRGLAIGPMSTVAPITAVIGAALPVAVRLASGSEAIGLSRAAGLGLAMAGIALVSRGPASERSGWAGPLLGVAGGLGFGAAFACFAGFTPGSLFWPLAFARLLPVPFLYVALARTGATVIPRGPAAVLATAGGDLLGNLLFVVATRTKVVVVAVVLSSLYPAVTVLLARALLAERPRPAQWIGLAGVVGAVALMAAGP